MAAELWLKARIRRRDHDIVQELERRNLSFGEMADLVREGVRRVLFDQVPKAKTLDPIFSQLTEKEPDITEDAEALVDQLINF